MQKKKANIFLNKDVPNFFGTFFIAQTRAEDAFKEASFHLLRRAQRKYYEKVKGKGVRK